MNNTFSTFLVIYFIIGLIFAISFALFYHWTVQAYFSPNFYIVILTWPLQIFGFLKDFLAYGFAGKPLYS